MQQPMRYRYYRVHKFVIAFINDVTRFIGRTDFRDLEQVQQVNQRVQAVIGLMQGHARHEDDVFHKMLEAKGSKMHQQVEQEHRHHDDVFNELNVRLNAILDNDNADQREVLGYEFYLTFRQFEADNMDHINAEEIVNLPELQRLYTDEELKAVDKNLYANLMSVEDMVNMCSGIFPYMDANDHLFFLGTIHEAVPDKFAKVFAGISTAIDPDSQQPMWSQDQIDKYREHFGLVAAAV